MHAKGNFDSTSLLLFFFVNTLMACIMMSGISLSGGRFVPLIASGAAFGRFFGQSVANPLNKYLLSRDRTVGLYALLGGAALVGGVDRMVLSLTVILMEATSNVRFGLPLLVTLIFARWVGTFLLSEI
jgi:H+/Cl- antiporter ClcA